MQSSISLLSRMDKHSSLEWFHESNQRGYRDSGTVGELEGSTETPAHILLCRWVDFDRILLFLHASASLLAGRSYGKSPAQAGNSCSDLDMKKHTFSMSRCTLLSNQSHPRRGTITPDGYNPDREGVVFQQLTSFWTKVQGKNESNKASVGLSESSCISKGKQA